MVPLQMDCIALLVRLHDQCWLSALIKLLILSVMLRLLYKVVLLAMIKSNDSQKLKENY